MARSLRCPRCSTIVTVAEGQAPLCPRCGFGGPGASSTAPGPAPPPAPSAPPGFSSPPPPQPPGFSSPPPGPYAQGGYQGYPPAGGQPQTSGTAITALVLGILALCMWWVPFIGPFIGLLSGVLAIVFGILGMRQVDGDPQRYGGKGLAVAGLVLGIVGLVIALLAILVLAAIFGEFSDYGY